MHGTKLERYYETQLVKKLEKMFPGCYIQRNDPTRTQGIPDLTIFYDDMWAMLEVKAYENAPTQPNQHYYVDRMNNMSFAAFICPENEKEVLNALQCAFNTRGKARVS